MSLNVEMDHHVTVEDLGDRLIVTNANAAQRNPLSEELYAKYGQALKTADSTDRITSVILTGAGRFFCSGGNLNTLKSRTELSFGDRQRKVDELHTLVRKIRDCSKPVIAAIEGGAAGAGVSLALASDFLVASRTATFTVAYVKAGLTPDGGVTSSLLQALPRALVNELCLLGAPISVERLHQMGVINFLAEPEGAMARAMELADRLSSGPTETIGQIKSLLSKGQYQEPDAQLNSERDAMSHAVVRPEAREGIDAFLNKRKPEYKKSDEAK